MMDIDNYILYQLSQIYFDNTDWPGNNVKYWRAPSRKWRWILFDTDFGFGTWNYFSYLNNTLAFALATGWVQLNSLKIQEESWSGDYFRNVPISLKAVAAPGYSFVRWTGDITSTNPQLTLNVTAPIEIEAVFVEGEVSAISAISEINAFSYYPNPSKAALNIHFELARKQALQISLYDQDGQLVKLLFHAQMNAGQQRLSYPLPLLPSGSYYLEVCNEKKECLTRQWVKIQQG